MIEYNRLIASFLQVDSWIVFGALKSFPFKIRRITDRFNYCLVEAAVEYILIYLLEVDNTGIEAPMIEIITEM